MKNFTIKSLLLAVLSLVFAFKNASADDWPKIINTENGTQIKIYQPEPESFKGNVLQFRSAISVTQPGSAEPVFGAFWSTAKVETDRDNRVLTINSLDVTSIRIPAINDQDTIDYIDDAIEGQFPNVAGPISLDEIVATLNQNHEEAKLSQDISTKPPKVMFVTQPSMLVIIDGEPRIQHNSELNVDMVVNSPFTIIKNEDGRYYLYGSKHWYVSNAATGPYDYTSQIPQNIQSIEQAIRDKAQQNNSDNQSNGTTNSNSNVIPGIIVSTSPTELIQSNGEPNFTPIQGTSLLYVSNSNNDIFMDENSQHYFVLISGRWYQTKSLSSNDWTYTPADRLPGDFAKIPAGSQKDNVLSSVAGTDAAKDAVMDAQIPQTAKVDRNTATTQVVYDGVPKFTDIEGTNLQYAVNTSSTVLRNGGDGRFYVVDNGVWFVSDRASGPYVVSTVRPADVDLIPPSYPVYNAKYVNIYDVSPDYVYMGYTPGYLNSYIYGPTVVYGTGFYYAPWYGAYYYPRPWSWGFNYCYTPYYGWGFGWGYSSGWFGIGFGWGVGFGYGYGGYGWWGPSFYHPACWGGWHGGPHPYGFYGYSNYSHANIHVNYANNVYRYRGGVSSQNYTRSASTYNGTRPMNGRPAMSNSQANGNPGSNGYRPSANNGNRPPANNSYGYNNAARSNNYNPAASRPSVYSDRQGNVYQGQSSNWQQRQNRAWSPVNNSRPEVQNLNRQQVDRSRGEMRVQNFQRMQSAPSSFGGGGGSSRPSGGGGGGGARSSGGGGGGSHGGGSRGR